MRFSRLFLYSWDAFSTPLFCAARRILLANIRIEILNLLVMLFFGEITQQPSRMVLGIHGNYFGCRKHLIHFRSQSRKYNWQLLVSNSIENGFEAVLFQSRCWKTSAIKWAESALNIQTIFEFWCCASYILESPMETPGIRVVIWGSNQLNRIPQEPQFCCTRLCQQKNYTLANPLQSQLSWPWVTRKAKFDIVNACFKQFIRLRYQELAGSPSGWPSKPDWN